MSNINLSNFETGDSSFQDLYVYRKLYYDFDNDEVTVKKLNVTGISSFANDVSFSGDITLDEITCRNANVTGVATVGTDLYLNGKLFDADGDFGTAGQILSSDGTDLNWIDASTTSVANANNVGINVNSTNANQFITFAGASSGNNPIRVNSNLRYNPSTGTLSATSFSGGGAVTINTNGDNRIITGSATAGELNGEVSLTYDGTTLATGGDSTGVLLNIGDDGATNTKVLQIKRSSSKTTIPNIQGVNAGVGAGDFELQGEGGNVAIGGVTPSEKLHVDGSVRITGGIRDKDNELGTSGQVLSSTGSQLNWIDAFSGDYNDLSNKPTLFSGDYGDLSNKPSLFSGNYNDLSNLPTITSSLVAQARSAIDTSTSTQFNPVGYVDKLTLTVSNVQSTSKILLFFRMALGHNGSGTTLGRVTGPSLFGGQTQFETGSGVNTHGILFDTSNSTTREFKIQYADNGGVSSTISNTELFAVELKVSS